MTKRICRKEHKIILRDELEAMIVLARRINLDRGEKRYYKCGNHYHLTSQDKRIAA